MNNAQQQRVYDQLMKAYNELCLVEVEINKHNSTERQLWDEVLIITQNLLKASQSPLLAQAIKPE